MTTPDQRYVDKIAKPDPRPGSLAVWPLWLKAEADAAKMLKHIMARVRLGRI